MTTPTDDDRSLVTVVASATALPGKEDDLRAALEALVEPTLGERGCVSYDLHESIDEPGTFVFYENWESEEALAAHGVSEHIAAFGERIGDLVAGGGPTVTRVRRIA